MLHWTQLIKAIVNDIFVILFYSQHTERYCVLWLSFWLPIASKFCLSYFRNGYDMTCLSHLCGMHDFISINAKSFSPTPTPSLILTRTDKFLTFNIMHAINSCYDYSGNAGTCLHLEQYFLCNIRKLPWAVIIIIFWLAQIDLETAFSCNSTRALLSKTVFPCPYSWFIRV